MQPQELSSYVINFCDLIQFTQSHSNFAFAIINCSMQQRLEKHTTPPRWLRCKRKCRSAAAHCNDVLLWFVIKRLIRAYKHNISRLGCDVCISCFCHVSLYTFCVCGKMWIMGRYMEWKTYEWNVNCCSLLFCVCSLFRVV